MEEWVKGIKTVFILFFTAQSTATNKSKAKEKGKDTPKDKGKVSVRINEMKEK